MQSSGYLSVVVSGSADRYVQERIQEAERHALVKIAKGESVSLVSRLRLFVGQSFVGVGRRIAGRPRRQRQVIEPQSALKLAR